MIDTPVAMLASTLLLTNVESHKRAASRGRLLMDSSASNPSLVQGLTRPTMDPTQIKSKETRGCVMFLQSLLSACSKDPALAPSRFADTDGSIPRDAKKVAITWTNHWCSTPSGKPWRSLGSPSGPHATPSSISLPRMGSTEGKRAVAVG